jgi:K+ transporter
VLGVLSLILWALIITITLKYVVYNKGEGGTLSLMALAQRALGNSGAVIVRLGIVSAALFFGDAVLTPALSVLSAVEGLKVVTPAFGLYVVPLTIVILLVLFAVQSRGTAKVAAFFGWFIAIALAGLLHIGFLTSDPASAPTALLHSLKHYKVLHEKNVILTIEAASTPRVDPAERVRIEPVGETFSRVHLRFGFMETPNVPKALAIARKLGWQFDIMSTSFFLSRRALKPSRSGMPIWQDLLFIKLARTANDATDYFNIPTGRVVEVGTQVTI